MKLRLFQLVSFVAVMLVPALAFANEGGSETGGFAELYAKHGAIVAVLASFGFGFVASLTPCVYPMVPITVSIFGATGGQTTRLRGAALSATFVLGIATLFTPMGIVSALSGKVLGSALSNAWVVTGLALLFTALAASMFGAFELALPSRLTNRLTSVGGVGFKGAFVMGLVMGLIAAPCTGPFLTGMVAVIATSKSVLLGSATLFSFALGLGVIFFVAGAFGANLPKGGAWMMGIKWVSGVGLAYMAFSYLRDRFAPVRTLVDHPSYAFGAVAALVSAVGLGLGVLHVLAERRRSPLAHLSKRAKLGSIFPAVAGTAMLFTWVHLNHEVEDPATAQAAPAITWLTDEETALAQSKAEGRPMLIDFRAEWCGVCKDLERDTFTDLAVRREAQRFVALRADLTEDDDEKVQAIRKKYKVGALPVVVLLDASGKEVLRFNELVKPARFSSALKCNGGKSSTRLGMND